LFQRPPRTENSSRVLARWEYDVKVDPNTPEGIMQAVLQQPREWVPADLQVLEDAGFMELLARFFFIALCRLHGARPPHQSD